MYFQFKNKIDKIVYLEYYWEAEINGNEFPTEKGKNFQIAKLNILRILFGCDGYCISWVWEKRKNGIFLQIERLIKGRGHSKIMQFSRERESNKKTLKNYKKQGDQNLNFCVTLFLN